MTLQQREYVKGLDNVLGRRDWDFINKKSVNSKFPESSTSDRGLTLFQAIEFGDLETLQIWINDNRHKVNSYKNADGETLLHIAVLYGHKSLVQTLLCHGADPNIHLPISSYASTFLNCNSRCSVTPRSENFKFSSILDPSGATPVHYACSIGDLDVLQLLVDKNPQDHPAYKIERNNNLLVFGIAGGNPEVVRFLLQNFPETNCFDEDDNNAFGIATLMLESRNADTISQQMQYTFKQIILMLAKFSQAQINHKNSYGLTTMDMARISSTKAILAGFGGQKAKKKDVSKLMEWDRNIFRMQCKHLSTNPSKVVLR